MSRINSLVCLYFLEFYFELVLFTFSYFVSLSYKEYIVLK